MNFTPSKQQISNNELVTKGNNTLISAGAGCSKSTSLRFFAQQNPNKNFLVLCFNKANAVEALEHPDRPKNIFYATGHSLAFGKVVVGNMKNSFNNSGLNYTDISETQLQDSLFFPPCVSLSEERFAITLLRKRIKNAVELYCRSASKNIEQFAFDYFSEWLISETILVNDPVLGPIMEKSIALTEEQRMELAKFTKQYWLNCMDATRPEVFGHDQYLKMFHLKGFSISEFYDKQTKQKVPVDVLCLDECQDSNPVILSIFNSFSGQKIVVGDSAQQLYSWRGAVNAMHFFRDENYTEGFLTESFRFNQTIANEANKILRVMGENYSLTGVGQQKEIRSKAILARTNGKILTTLLNLVEENPNATFTLAMDLQDISRKLYHINSVFWGEQPKYPDQSLQHIKTKQDLMEAMAISDEIASLSMLCQRLAQKAGTLHNGLTLLKQSVAAKGSSSTNITLSTIHKSKGLEWDEVTILDDLIVLEKNEDGEADEESLEIAKEKFYKDFDLQCLAYVACTRAKVKVNLPWYLPKILEDFSENWRNEDENF